MENIFKKQELIKQTFTQKMFNKLPKENFLIELENLLSENEENIDSIAMNTIEGLKSKYKINSKLFLHEREMLLDRMISKYLWDNKLSENEQKDLNHLCSLLEVSKDYLNNRITEEGKIIYQNKVRCVIADNIVDSSEKEELESIKKNFSISDETEEEIYNKECKEKIQSFVDEIVKRRRMSPTEDKQLKTMITGMGLNVSFSNNDLEVFKKYWQIENEELEEIESPINIQKSENLYFKSHINWYEERKETIYASYGGISFNTKIAKGISIRNGYMAPKRHTKDVYKLIDTGEVFFTNKRIIFMGEKGNKTIPFQKILSIVPYRNGIDVKKDTGKTPFFECENAELMTIYIVRLIRDFLK